MERANRPLGPSGGVRRRRGRHRRTKLAAIVGLLSLGLLVLPSGLAASHLPTPGKVHKITIKETDYKFTPDHLTFTVGEIVRITLENASSNPATKHEFLMGKGVKYSKTKFGRGHPAGWKTPLISNDIKFTFGSGKKIGHLQKGAPGHAELLPGGQITEQFKVPDKPGKWYFACFEQKGEHFLKGMKGTITIKPKNGSAKSSSGGKSGGTNKSKSGIGNGSGAPSNSSGGSSS